MKNIISNKENFFATHTVLFYTIDNKKNIPTKPTDENPLISDGKQRPSSLMEKAVNLLKSFDAKVKYSKHKHPPPHSS
jgi:hypothetical protein